MAEREEPLLDKKTYYKNCPGCIQELKNEHDRGIPYQEFFYVWLVALCNGMAIAALFPFLYFMIKDLKIAKTEEDIGFYAGFVGASYMVGRALTSTIWGLVADRYGRKPVIIIGLTAMVIFNTLFGLSMNYWMAILTRFFLGAFNGLFGTISAYSIEVCNKKYQALALSIVATSWGIGLIVGPAIGGYLSQPAEKYPYIFSPQSVFGRFPYFLPCVCITLVALPVLISCIWLPETLHNHKRNHEEDIKDSLPKQNLFKNRPFLSCIMLYSIFNLHDMAYIEIFPLWAESDRKFGGLSFLSQDVGQVFAISGFCLLLFQLFIYPQLERLVEPLNSARICAVLTIPLLFGYPFMTYLSGPNLYIAVNCASALKNILTVSLVTTILLLQNKVVPQDQRGTANGISMTTMSLFKAVAPAGGGAIFSWAQKRQQASFFPGDQIVFFILNVIGFLGFLLMFKPFTVLAEKENPHPSIATVEA